MKQPVWTAIITPMLNNGEIDYKSFENLLKRQEKAKNGVVILGSTGEGLALNLEEKKEIVRFTCALKLSTPVMVGVGGFNLGETLSWLKFCEEFPLQGYLLVTPLYAKPGPKGQTLWFKTLMDAVTKPCMLYNIPGRAAIALSHQTVKELSQHKNFWSIKEASGSLQEFSQYVSDAGGKAVYSGDDGLTPFFASLGARGVVSVASNVWPLATLRFTECSLEGKHQHLFPVWNEACAALFRASNPIPAKVLLHEKGLITTATLRAPLTHEELTDVNELRKVDKKIKHWLKEHFNQEEL